MQTQPTLILAQQSRAETATTALVIGTYLCAADFIVAQVLKAEPTLRHFLGFQSAAFFYVLMVGMFCLKIAGLARFGSSGVVKDVREICGYDVLTALLGLVLYLLGKNVLPAKMLNYGFFAVLMLRLCWNFKTSEGAVVTSWPVFGLIGLFSKSRGTRGTLPNWHNNAVYLCIGLSPVAGYGLIHLSVDEIAIILAGGAITFLLLQAPFFIIPKAPQEPAPQAAPKTAAMPSAPSPMPDGQGGTGGAIDLNPEEQKLIQLYRGMAAEKRPRVLNAMVALKKTFDEHEPDQAPGD